MMWNRNNYDGGSWLWMSGMMLLLAGGLIALPSGPTRALSSTRQTGDRGPDTRRRRLAAGEISQADFESTKKALEG